MNKSTTVRKKRSSSSVTDNAGAPQSILSGVLAGVSTAIICCIISSLICIFSSDPDKLTSPLATVSSILAHFTGGFFAAKKKNAPLPCGLATGGILAFIFWITSLCFSASYSYSLNTVISLLIRISMVAVSLVGAILGGNQPHKRKRRRR